MKMEFLQASGTNVWTTIIYDWFFIRVSVYKILLSNIKDEAGLSHHTNGAVTLSKHYDHILVTSPQLISGQTVRGLLPT